MYLVMPHQGPPPKVGELRQASQDGKLDDVKQLIAAGANLEERDEVSFILPNVHNVPNARCMMRWTRSLAAPVFEGILATMKEVV